MEYYLCIDICDDKLFLIIQVNYWLSSLIYKNFFNWNERIRLTYFIKKSKNIIGCIDFTTLYNTFLFFTMERVNYKLSFITAILAG